MSGWAAALISVVVVINPVGVARVVDWLPERGGTQRRRVAAVAAAAGVALGVVVLVTGPILELIDVTTPTFRLGAAVVIGLTGGRWMLAPLRPVTDPGDSAGEAAIVGLSSILAPGPVMAAMAAGADGGLAAGICAVVLAVGVTGAAIAAPRLNDPAATALTRLIGASALVVAVAIGLDSARTV